MLVRATRRPRHSPGPPYFLSNLPSDSSYILLRTFSLFILRTFALVHPIIYSARPSMRLPERTFAIHDGPGTRRGRPKLFPALPRIHPIFCSAHSPYLFSVLLRSFTQSFTPHARACASRMLVRATRRPRHSPGPPIFGIQLLSGLPITIRLPAIGSVLILSPPHLQFSPAFPLPSYAPGNPG